MIIVSAVDRADKGKAFEEFTAILLSKLGYEIQNVRIRRAGRELDVKASSKVTGVPLLAECKALSKPLTGPLLSKFYGIYDHEYRKPSHGLVGLLISLSGFNSEAIDYYEEKDKEVQGRFKIIGPKQILKLAGDADLISDDLTVQHVARKSWPHDLDKTLLIITKSGLYRVQLLKRNGRVSHFLAYRAKCEDPTAHEVENLHGHVHILRKLEFFNLLARKETLLTLSQSEAPVSLEVLCDATKQSGLTVRTETSYLTDRSLIEEPRKDHFTPVRDVRAFAEISRELLTSTYKYQFLKSNYFKNMNTGVLSDFCLSRRFLRAEDDSEHALLTSLFRFSPSALNQALFGETDRYRVTHEHATEIGANPERISELARSSFYTELIQPLLRDLHDNENLVVRELHPVVGLREEYHVTLANTLGVIFDITAGGVSTFLKAGQDLKAGQLVATDPLTAFNSTMTAFNLTQDPQCIEDMKKFYTKLSTEGTSADQLVGMANNIGVSLMALGSWLEAKQWLAEGLSHSTKLPQLHGNLARVLEQLGDLSEASASLRRARELDPTYEVKGLSSMVN